jgi:hypothetical protein
MIIEYQLLIQELYSMILKRELHFFLRVPKDYYDFVNLPIPIKVNEFGDEYYEDIEVDQFCLNSKQINMGRQFWYYQGAFDHEREEKDNAHKDYYSEMEKVLRKSEEAIEILKMNHAELFRKGDFFEQQRAFEATMLLFSKVIRVLRMGIVSLRGQCWESIAMLRMTTEACILSLYFTYLEENGNDTVDLQRWFRINISPPISSAMKVLHDAYEDEENREMLYQLRRMYHHEGMTLHCTIHDLYESFMVNTEKGKGNKSLFPKGFDYAGSWVRWKLYDYAKASMPSKIYYCVSVFKSCMEKHLSFEQKSGLSQLLKAIKANDYSW